MKKKLSVMAAVTILAWSGVALAADWNFYGSARMSTFWSDSDLNDTTNLDESLQGNSRIGANVRVSDELTGRFEYGASDGNANVRLLYGEWNFGAGSLLVGKDYTPLYMPVSNQVYGEDNNLDGWGEAYPGRHAQIKLKFGGFEIAAIEMDSKYYNAGSGAIEDSNVETQIPRVELRYKTELNALTLGIAGGYSTFEYNDNEDVDSYVGVIMAKVNAGSFFLGAQGFGGQNVGNLIKTDTTGDELGNGYAKIDSGNVLDNDALGFDFVVGYIINDMFSLEAGYGYMQTEYDNADSEDEVMSYYIQAPITLAPGVIVTPEVGMVDYDENGQDEITYFGAKWQINF